MMGNEVVVRIIFLHANQCCLQACTNQKLLVFCEAKQSHTMWLFLFHSLQTKKSAK